MENTENTEKFDSDAKNNFADRLMKLQKAVVALRSVQLEQACGEDELCLLKEIPNFVKFFELPLNSPEELEMKKRFVRGIIIANERGLLPVSLPESTEEIAEFIDSSLHTAKVAYFVSQKKLSSEEGFEEIYDKMVSSLATHVRRVVAVAFPFIINKAVDCIASRFPLVNSIRLFLKKVLPFAGSKVADGCEVGIKKIAQISKPLARKVVAGVKSAYERGKSVVKSCGNKIRSIFSW